MTMETPILLKQVTYTNHLTKLDSRYQTYLRIARLVIFKLFIYHDASI